ncbi:LIMR family protein [Forsythia ovata]|uniref:LIMR family protein n=1 Tax=Forsythia ovata TaxID=205694 RepID=A0ABD1X7W7_9LAMI
MYILINYQHPDDANQAYFPKFVVVLGLSVAAISILMLPADVANRQSCRHAIYNGACNLTLPMKDLWLAIYMIDAILVFFVIPFAMFYYEGDQDKSECLEEDEKCIALGDRDSHCLISRSWDFIRACGKDGFHCQTPIFFHNVRHLSSSTGQQCVGSGARQCSAYSASPSSETTWTMRTTFPEYIVALATIVGSLLFTIFGGVGIASLPLGLIVSFIRCPKAVITLATYKILLIRVLQELLLLEEDVKALEEMYPQGEKAEAAWAMTVLGYLAKLVLGVLGLIVSVAWVAHIVIYLLIDPALSPFLNEVFIKLDDIWGLLGTAAFAFFCFYLLLAVIAGTMMLGLELVFITIHPMKWGATLMNSFLFNVGPYSSSFNQCNSVLCHCICILFPSHRSSRNIWSHLAISPGNQIFVQVSHHCHLSLCSSNQYLLGSSCCGIRKCFQCCSFRLGFAFFSFGLGSSALLQPFYNQEHYAQLPKPFFSFCRSAQSWVLLSLSGVCHRLTGSSLNSAGIAIVPHFQACVTDSASLAPFFLRNSSTGGREVSPCDPSAPGHGYWNVTIPRELP